MFLENLGLETDPDKDPDPKFLDPDLVSMDQKHRGLLVIRIGYFFIERTLTVWVPAVFFKIDFCSEKLHQKMSIKLSTQTIFSLGCG